LPELPAAKEWRHKTTRPNELRQIDATNFFVAGWGYYKLIPVLDDFSRKIIAWDLMPDESAGSISEAMERAVEAAGVKKLDPKPVLLSDNGSGFSSDLLAKYLKEHGIRHIFGKPYHPQTQGKVERFNRRIKEGVCLLVYCGPDELRAALTEAIMRYNATPHEALKNVSPNDVYAGRQQEILKKREERKRWTLARRKIMNLEPSAKRN
jgi:transposase InsO family protein